MAMGSGFGKAGVPLGVALMATCVSMLLACAFALASTPPAFGKAKGIDVSRFQGTIDWKAVGTTKIKFAYVAASRGMGLDCLVAGDQCGADPYYDANRRAARAQGIRVGAYHRAFAAGNTRARAREDALREARVFCHSVGHLGKADLVPALDVEVPFVRLSPDRLRYWIRTWLEHVQSKLGVKPIIYTNTSSWASTGDTGRFARRGYRLWVANFGVSSPSMPAANWADKGWTMWQFSSTGRVRGIDGNVDRDRLAVPLSKLFAHGSGGGGGGGTGGTGGGIGTNR